MEEAREFTKTTLVNRCFRLGRVEPHPDDLTLVQRRTIVPPRVLFESDRARTRHHLGKYFAVGIRLKFLVFWCLKEPTALEPFQQECPWTSAELSWKRGTKASLALGLTSNCSKRFKHIQGKLNLLMLRA